MNVPEITLERLPASVDAEKSILGAILLDNAAFYEAAEQLNYADFVLDSHQRIYAAMALLMEEHSAVDIVTMAEELSRRREVSRIGGVAYLAALTEGLPRRLSITEYVRIVKEKSRMRRLINIFSVGITRAADESEESDKVTEDLQGQLIEEAAEVGNDAVKIASLIGDVEAEVERKRQISDERAAAELTWGIGKLDNFSKGAFFGEFTVLAGESAGGKTAMAVQMTLANAQQGVPCAWFSIEMSRNVLARRFYPQMGKSITANHMRDPRLMNLEHMKELKSLSSELAKLPIWIDDTSPIARKKMLARMRMMYRKHGIKLFVVDYLQLIVGEQFDREANVIRDSVYAIRDFQKAHSGCHTLLLSQYSNAEKFVKKVKRSKRDLYGGSAIHHAAQNVILLSVESAEEKDRGSLLEVELYFAKQREGRPGKIYTYFDPDCLRYTEPHPYLATT